jgi:hypothetical protein
VGVPCGEGVANHTDPESCVADREVRREALTGDPAGWVLSPVISFRMPTTFCLRKAIRVLAPTRAWIRSGGVGDPSMSGRSLCGNREVLRLTVGGVGGPHWEGSSCSQ